MAIPATTHQRFQVMAPPQTIFHPNGSDALDQDCIPSSPALDTQHGVLLRGWLYIRTGISFPACDIIQYQNQLPGLSVAPQLNRRMKHCSQQESCHPMLTHQCKRWFRRMCVRRNSIVNAAMEISSRIRNFLFTPRLPLRIIQNDFRQCMSSTGWR